MKNTLIILFLFCLSSLSGQEKYHCFELDYEQDLNLDFLPEKRIYFLGETHNIASNDLLDFQFIKYLNKKYGISAFVKEGAYSYIYFLNEYIKYENEEMLDTLSNSLGYYVAEQRAFLKQLIKLNSTLEVDQKIRIYSIDAESFFHIQPLVRYWKMKWGSPTNADIVRVLDAIENYKSSTFTLFPNKSDKKETERVLSIIQPIFKANQEVFKNYLKEDFIHLKMLIENHATNNRNENTLESNFQKLDQMIHANGYFFSYGKLHAQKQKGWLADRIDKSIKFNNSVVSLIPYYKNSSIYWKGSGVELNDFDDLNKDQKSSISSLKCEKNWLITTSDDSAFDFYIISNNQSGITLVQEAKF